MGWELEILQGVAATAEHIGNGVYNVLSSTPMNAFLVDNATLNALKQLTGTEIAPLVNDLGETIGYIGKTVASSNGSTAISSTLMKIVQTSETVTQELIDAAIPLVNGGTTADLELGQEITKASLAAGAGAGGALGTGVGATALATVAGPAIAVALGVAAGTALYNIAPQFWTDVEQALEAAGKTIGGKIVSFFNSEGEEYYDDETVNIIKQALIDAGLLTTDDPVYQRTSNLTTGIPQPITPSGTIVTTPKSSSKWTSFNEYQGAVAVPVSKPNHGEGYALVASASPSFTLKRYRVRGSEVVQMYNQATNLSSSYTYNGQTVYYRYGSLLWSWEAWNDVTITPPLTGGTGDGPSAWTMVYGDGVAVVPQVNTLPSIPSFDSNVSPVPTSPTDPLHNERNQNPTDFYDPTPTIESGPEDSPDPYVDPNPQPDPEPAPNPNPTDPTAPKDPTNPNPPGKNGDEGDPEPTPPVIPMVANALSKVFNPTQGEVDSLGQYLWSSTHIEDILKLFQNPIDGIVAFLKIYVTPSTGSHEAIKLGYLDSGVTAAVVTQQITTVDCGLIEIPLNKENATDYPPYTDIHIYLPFVGIVPLNPYDLVGSQLAVRYRVDCYTGACIAQLKVTRDDMSSVLYEYAGNCAQQLPLTSGNFVQMVANVVSSAVMGGLVSGTKNVAQRATQGALKGGVSALIHGNVEIARSGSLVGNTGMLGSRVPYVIITRAISADAANYRDFYGYPANSTVYLKNCSGYTRVKDIILHTSATQPERTEIENLLKSGVYI